MQRCKLVSTGLFRDRRFDLDALRSCPSRDFFIRCLSFFGKEFQFGSLFSKSPCCRHMFICQGFKKRHLQPLITTRCVRHEMEITQSGQRANIFDGCESSMHAQLQRLLLCQLFSCSSNSPVFENFLLVSLDFVIRFR